MPYDAFGAVDWYELEGRGHVAIVHAVPGFDPNPLVGQLVTIDGVARLVRGVETGPVMDESGTTFGLLI